MLAFALPILFIVGVALFTYLPSLSVSTQYDFVYAVCSNESSVYRFRCDEYLNLRFDVENNRLKVNQVDLEELINENSPKPKRETPENFQDYEVRLFLHDTSSNQSREITLDQAQNFKLSDLSTSPDEVTFSGDYSNSPGFLFFNTGSSYNYYLEKGGDKARLDLKTDNSRFYKNNFKFIGWVI